MSKMAPLCYRRHRFPPEIIQHAIWLYVRFTLSYRDVEELLAERGKEGHRFRANLAAFLRVVSHLWRNASRQHGVDLIGGRSRDAARTSAARRKGSAAA